MKKFWIISICHLLILMTYPFQAIGSDRDPETGEVLKTKEETQNSK